MRVTHSLLSTPTTAMGIAKVILENTQNQQPVPIDAYLLVNKALRRLGRHESVRSMVVTVDEGDDTDSSVHQSFRKVLECCGTREEDESERSHNGKKLCKLLSKWIKPIAKGETVNARRYFLTRGLTQTHCMQGALTMSSSRISF